MTRTTTPSSKHKQTPHIYLFFVSFFAEPSKCSAAVACECASTRAQTKMHARISRDDNKPNFTLTHAAPVCVLLMDPVMNILRASSSCSTEAREVFSVRHDTNVWRQRTTCAFINGMSGPLPPLTRPPFPAPAAHFYLTEVRF